MRQLQNKRHGKGLAYESVQAMKQEYQRAGAGNNGNRDDRLPPSLRGEFRQRENRNYNQGNLRNKDGAKRSDVVGFSHC